MTSDLFAMSNSVLKDINLDAQANHKCIFHVFDVLREMQQPSLHHDACL